MFYWQALVTTISIDSQLITKKKKKITVVLNVKKKFLVMNRKIY